MDWPTEEWADALNDLSAAWRDGGMAGWLFNGTRARNATPIALGGMRSTDGFATKSVGGDAVSFNVVHLGTPEVAAFYMRDAVQGSAIPALVAVDVGAWARARSGSGSPLSFLVDENSIEFPVLPALGARTRDDVRSRLAVGDGWERALAVTGAVALDESIIPVEFLRIIRRPSQIAALIAKSTRSAQDHEVVERLTGAAAEQPWMAAGWRFEARKLGSNPVPPEELDDAEHLAEYGMGRCA